MLRMIWGAAVAVAVVIAGCGGETSGPTQEDFSSFTSFSLEQSRGWGFCLEEGAVFDASIAAKGDQLELTSRIFRGQRTDCPEASRGGIECMNIDAPQVRVLTSEEVEQFRAKSRAIKIVSRTGDRSNCESDCRLTKATWDGASYVSGTCSATGLDDTYARELSKLIDAYASK